MVWYGASGRLSGTTGNSLTTLGRSFAQYSLRSTAPSGAQYALLFIRTPANGGNIWVTDAFWA